MIREDLLASAIHLAKELDMPEFRVKHSADDGIALSWNGWPNRYADLDFFEDSILEVVAFIAGKGFSSHAWNVDNIEEALLTIKDFLK